MLQALNHSRPPSYRSHVSDHPVIESSTGTTNAGVTQPLNNNNNTANHQTLSSTSSNNHNLNNNLRNHTTSTTAQNEQVQVAEVYAAPGSPESSQSVSVVLNNSRINSNNPAGVPNISNNNQRSPGHISREIVGGQDISIVPVVSSHHHRHDSVVFEGKTDLQEQYQYHVKSGNPADSSSKPTAENARTELPGLYNHLFTTTTQENQEKPSMVTIVQTSVTNSEPVIVTVSGSMEQGLNATSSDSGSDFSELRASPAEVQILATL